MKKTNFAFRYEWTLAIAHLSPLERLEVFEETIRYARTGKACFKSGLAAVAFNTHILPDFERRARAAEYRARLRERRRAMAEEAQAKAKSIQELAPAIPPVEPLGELNRADAPRHAHTTNAGPPVDWKIGEQ